MKKAITIWFSVICILLYSTTTAYALPADPVEEGSEEEEAGVIETNLIPNWPTGPELNAEAAILMEADTGIILYAKNIHKHMYPASTTKMMTALLAAENSKMEDEVTFSYDAVFSLEEGSSNIGIDPGQSMPMVECLYGLMVASANEVANAVAEHVSGSIDGFAELMNEKGAELGLRDTHYTNANGLFDEEHYTSAYDLALVANAFFENEYLSRIGNTPSYHFEATKTQPDDFYVRNKHKLINGEIPYEGIKGGKTGYTSEAGETLVTLAEQNGLRLICVILNEVSPDQFNDTVKLFDYGFGSFARVKVAEHETGYTITGNEFFPTSIDILGSSERMLSLNTEDSIVMPKNITFDNLTSKLNYQTDAPNDAAYIDYYYQGVYLGHGTINYLTEQDMKELIKNGVLPIRDSGPEKNEKNEQKPIFINIVSVVYYVLGFGAVVVFISFIYAVIVNYNLFESIKRRRALRKKRRRGNDLTF